MDYSKRVDMTATYSVPPSYQPPGTSTELAKSTDYPNMNSVQYRLTEAVPLPDQKLPPFFDLAAVNGAGNVIVAGNNYTGRLWESGFCGWQKVEDLCQEKKISFSRRCDAIITALSYTMDDALFLLGNDKGSIELWSTGNAIRGPGLYLVDKQNQHIGAITALDTFKSTARTVISGSMDGCIMQWDSSQGDLQSTTRLQHAHLGAITSIATDASQESLAVSCSYDRSALMWDFRELKPGVALYEMHDVPFTTIRWCSDSDWNRLVAIGDEAGRVYFIDARQPNVFLETLECFDRKVHKLSFHRKHFAVLGNTPEVKFYNDKSKVVQLEKSASNYVRDIIWGETNNDGITCTLIGWDSYVKQLSLHEIEQ